MAAAEVYKDDGPFQSPERLRRFNVFLRATRDIDKGSKLSMTWMSYGPPGISLLLPKLRMVLPPIPQLDLFVDAGAAFTPTTRGERCSVATP